MSTQSLIITGGKLLQNGRLIQSDLHIRHGQIEAIYPASQPSSPSGFHPSTSSMLDARGKYLLPGFIDIHHHGAKGFDCVWGRYNTATDSFTHHHEIFHKALETSLKFCLQKGITRLFPTTMAAPKDQLSQSLEWMDEFLRNHPQWDSMIAGINLEGSFLKDPAYAGAQNPVWFYPPEMAFIEAIQQACGHRLRIVNLPPEHGRQAIRLTRQLREAGIVVAGGHSAASFHEFKASVDAGLQLAVHFLNGPSKSSSKPFGGGGAVEAMLQCEEVLLELIVDGWHIHPAYVRDTIARKGIGGVIAITDSMFASGINGLRRFSLGGLNGEVSEQSEYLQLAGSEDTLFGSILTPEQALENLLNWFTTAMPGVWQREHPALSFEEALDHAVRMLSANPARLLGLKDAGNLEVDKVADVLVVEIAEGENGYAVEVETVVLGGQNL